MVQDWKNIEIGKKYKLEDGYSSQVEVEVLDKKIEGFSGEYVVYQVKILKKYRGLLEEGDIDWVGKNLSPVYEYLTHNLRFLDLDDLFSYT